MFKKTLVFFLLVLVVITLGIYWFYSASVPVSKDNTLKDFLIPKGSSASQVGASLEKDGLIKNALAFKLYVQSTGKQSKVQAGEFRLSPSYSLFRIVDELEKGPVEIWVTIPEGLRKEEIAQRFSSAFARNQDFIEEFLASSKGQEGFLFPDTYLFPKTASASAVVKKMRATFDKKIDDQMAKDIASSGYSLTQIITMASILERETITNEERPIVAGILFKRLKAGWPLQADATIEYALGKWAPPTKADLEINSSYNTYKFKGLPPAPIASPGLSSIKAAIYPSDSPYWFYLHDSQGTIHYARTIEEHNANIRKYL